MATTFVPLVTGVYQHFRADDILPPDLSVPDCVDDEYIPEFAVNLALAASEAAVLDEQQPLFVENVEWIAFTDAPVWYW